MNEIVDVGKGCSETCLFIAYLTGEAELWWVRDPPYDIDS